MENPELGSVGWMDLTVEDADTVRDFYVAVAGWKVHKISMGEYDDYSMLLPESGKPVGGVCHARGTNADVPPQWLMYVTVADIEASRGEVEARGGRLVTPIRGDSYRFCVVADPAGAVFALFQPAPSSS